MRARADGRVRGGRRVPAARLREPRARTRGGPAHSGFQAGVPIVLSHRVAPLWREYERTSTVVTSAYITPIMTSYVERLTEALSAEGMRVPPYITESNGGVMGARQAATKAVHTLFSGPVGGVVGTRAAGASVGLRDLISVDVGGTSFDVSLVRGGEA